LRAFQYPRQKVCGQSNEMHHFARTFRRLECSLGVRQIIRVHASDKGNTQSIASPRCHDTRHKYALLQAWKTILVGNKQTLHELMGTAATTTQFMVANNNVTPTD
jgi:hypothetical protein